MWRESLEECSPRALHKAMVKRNSEIVYMWCYAMFWYCRCPVSLSKLNAVISTPFFLSRKLGKLQYSAAIRRVIHNRFISHVGRLHIAHQISSTMNEWMACNLQRIENCCFVSTDFLRSFVLKLCALCTGEMISRDELSWFPAFDFFFFCIRQPKKMGTHKL